jgi:hypothetical protein
MSFAATSLFVSSLEHIVGFLVVLFALGLLWAITTLIGKLFARLETTDPGPALEAVDPPMEGGPTEEEVVAIAATISLLMGRRSRIVSLRSGTTKDWNREGRREHFASHRIR